MLTALAILTLLASTAATLVMLTFFVAAAPNGTPEHLARLKALALLVGGVWLAGVVGSTWALATGRHAAASGLGIAPALFCVALFIWICATEG